MCLIVLLVLPAAAAAAAFSSSHHQPTKKKPTPAAASAAGTKKLSKKRDPSLPPPPQRYSLPQLIEKIPPPPSGTDRSEWQHKGGWGLKFYRSAWARYAEPCYWTVTRFKPSTHGHKRKVWGVLTWRGKRRARTDTRIAHTHRLRNGVWRLCVEVMIESNNLSIHRPSGTTTTLLH